MSYQHYNMKLTTLSPIFIGDGNKLLKKEYIYDDDDDNDKIIIPDLMMMTEYFRLYNMISEYEKHMSDNNNKNFLGELIKKRRKNLKIVSNFTKYAIDAKNVSIKDAGGKFNYKDIATFIKDPYCLPYIPGSSIKGMIRTVLLCYEIVNNRNNSKLSNLLNQIYNESTHSYSEEKDYNKNMDLATLALEDEIFKSMNESVMRGLIIGDSRPLKTTDLTLSKKIDYNLDKKENLISVYRETIKPGVDIYFDISIDKSIFPYTMDDIFKAVNSFNEISNKYFYSRFERENEGENIVYLGGGTGFLSKTMIYPAFADSQVDLKNLYKDLEIGKDEAQSKYGDEKISKAVEVTHRIFKRTLGKIYKLHNHNIDLPKGISPYVCKCTRYNDELYNMGICRLDYAN